MIQKTHLDFLSLNNKIIIYSNIIMSSSASTRTRRPRGRSRNRSIFKKNRKNMRAPSRGRMVMYKPIPLRQHVFTERVISESNLPVNGAGLFQTFALQDIYNSTAYQRLFEYYKLDKVIITLRYKADLNPRLDIVNNASTGTQSVNEANPVVWFKVDHNDVSADTLDVMKASTRTKEIQFTNNRPKIDIVLKPAILSESYKSSVASTYVPKWGQWLTMDDPSVPHYGIKMYATGPAAQTYGGIVVSKKYYFTCKNNE